MDKDAKMLQLDFQGLFLRLNFLPVYRMFFL